MHTTQNIAKTKLPWFSRIVQHSAGNKVGLFYTMLLSSQWTERIVKANGCIHFLGCDLDLKSIYLVISTLHKKQCGFEMGQIK